MIIVIIDLPKTCCKRYRVKSVQICIFTDQKKLRIWTLFTHWHSLNIRIIKIYFCYFSNISSVMAWNAVPSSAPNILTNLSWVPPLMLLRKIETLGEINLDVKIVFFGLQYTKLFFRFTDLEFRENSNDFSFTIFISRGFLVQQAWQLYIEFYLKCFTCKQRLKCQMIIFWQDTFLDHKKHIA